MRRLHAGLLRNRGSVSFRYKRFLLSKSGAHPLSCSVAAGVCVPNCIGTEREADHLPLSSTMVKNARMLIFFLSGTFRCVKSSGKATVNHNILYILILLHYIFRFMYRDIIRQKKMPKKTVFMPMFRSQLTFYRK